MSVKGSKYNNDNQDKNLFFWFFEKRNQKQSSSSSSSPIPLVVWLTGGPGCSSTLALLFENGPCKVNPSGDGTFVNPHSWTEVAHVLWLDQPAGVGWSYGEEDDTNEDMISEDAYYFLQTFFQSHPEYVDSPLFIVGESYGGHYAPAIAHRVWKGNKEGADGTVRLNLGGLGVGNGLTNPAVQYNYYADMAYNNSHDIKTVSLETYESMKDHTSDCVSKIKRCNSAKRPLGHSFYCQSAVFYCNVYLTAPYYATGLNPYDIRKPCGDNDLCYDFTNIDTFLNSETTREALHVSDQSGTWVSCSNSVHQNMMGDWMSDLSSQVADLLNDNIPVLIYAGDVDFICNYMGNRAWTMELDWKGKNSFNAAGEHEWKGAGLARSADGLTFMQVYDAGHMVPTDQPVVALDMISVFLIGADF
jgi:cathepsin A (carboxypeptidase C)